MNTSDVETGRVGVLVEKGKAHLKGYNIAENVIHAQKCFSEAYVLCVRYLGKNDVRNIEILSLLAASHKYHIGLDTSSKDVIGLLEEMKRLQILNFGEKYSELVETFKRLATSYAQSRQFEFALKNYLQALEIQRETPELLDEDTAHTLERIGDVYTHLSDIKKARDYYIRSLEMREMTRGGNDAALAKIQMKITRATPISPSAPLSYGVAY